MGRNRKKARELKQETLRLSEQQMLRELDALIKQPIKSNHQGSEVK